VWGLLDRNFFAFSVFGQNCCFGNLLKKNNEGGDETKIVRLPAQITVRHSHNDVIQGGDGKKYRGV